MLTDEVVRDGGGGWVEGGGEGGKVDVDRLRVVAHFRPCIIVAEPNKTFVIIFLNFEI